MSGRLYETSNCSEATVTGSVMEIVTVQGICAEASPANAAETAKSAAATPMIRLLN